MMNWLFLQLCSLVWSADFDHHREGSAYTVAAIDDPDLVEASRAVVRLPGGTGFFVSESGLILTNDHVAEISGRQTTAIIDWDRDDTEGQRVDVSIVARDPDRDLALYRAFGHSPSAIIRWRESPPHPGEAVAVIGHPGESAKRVTFGTVVTGQVTVAGIPVTEYDALTGWGSSGSPVLDEQGRAVAIHWAWDFGGELHGELLGIRYPAVADLLEGRLHELDSAAP